ncbi:uncharacterized protein LOC142179805 [Nicotiana tabacum]|uniref:Uncharacterized protein LOC142179805 n=1 Tax=Nicotiana tabacum TaxID=4097 RepID=A0AC58UBC2_TOBAC
MNWFAGGDRNTKFFHNHVNIKRQKLKLKRIQNTNSNWLEIQELMANAAVEFFSNQFTQSGDTTMVTLEQNLELCKYPTIDEVKNAVFVLSGDSASGPDDFTGLFHQTCWDIVGEDIYMLIQEFYGGASLPKSITHTNLVLLPKKPQVQTFSDLRPISLSNFINKGLLEISSTYFEEDGVAEHFNMIMNLLVKNWYSMLINGQASWFFKSSKGVKQGDPLSPTLFIMSAEVLSRSLNNLFLYKNFKGFGIPKWTDPLNHLAYADDTIIFSSVDPYFLKKETVGSITVFQKGTFPFTYLGCPMFYTRRRKDYCNDLTKKVKVRLHSYKGKLLSFGGKATLITSVLQSLPTHILSVLDPPNNVIEQLHKIFSRFFWSSTDKGRSRHWTKWLNLCLPTEEGGVGVHITF